MGPLSRTTLRLEPGGETVLAVALLEGERRTVRVPLPALHPPALLPEAARPRPQVEVEGGGSARFLGWDEAPESDFWRGVPRGVRARKPPPLPSSDPRAGPALLLSAAAAFVLLVLRRRSAVTVLAATGLGAGAALLLPLAGGGEPTAALLDADAGGARGVLVGVAADRIELVPQPEGEPAGRLEVSPSGARLSIRVEGDPARWVFAAPGAGLARFVTVPLTLSRESNDGPSLDPVWLREPDGSWSARGRWERGAPLPPVDPAAGDAAPPGWLAGLPPGVSVLVARAEDGTWVRVSGL